MTTGSPRGRSRTPGPSPAGRLRLAGLVALGLALMGCRPDIQPIRRPHLVVAGGNAGAAPAALRRYGCNECHIVPGIRGANGLAGPPLIAFSRRTYIAGRLPNTPEALIQFILNPQAIKPGSAMPMTGISDQEARDVAAYLYTLR